MTAAIDCAADQPYSIPNFWIAAPLTDIDLPVGSWRSVGNSHNGFFFDKIIDEMALAAGADLMQFRLELALREHAPSAGVIAAVGEMAGWTGQTLTNIGRGFGLTYFLGTPVAEIVEVEDTSNGIRINKCWIACDAGTAL